MPQPSPAKTAFLRQRLREINSGRCLAAPRSSPPILLPTIDVGALSHVSNAAGFVRGQHDSHPDFAVVKRLRAAIKSYGTPKLSEGSLREYRKKANKINGWRGNTDDPPDIKNYVGTPSSVYAYRAALIWSAAERGTKALRERDRYRRGSIEYDLLMEEIHYCDKALTLYPPCRDRNQFLQRVRQDQMARIGLDLPAPSAQYSRRVARQSKVSAANRLNIKRPEWRDELHDHLLQRGSAWVLWAAVESVTGCRPAEIDGIRIMINDDGRLTFVIKGAKVTEQSGQPKRSLTIRDNSKAFEYLTRQLQAVAGKMVVTLPPANDLPRGRKDPVAAYEAAMRRAGVAVFGKQAKFSSYCFRHALAADIKAENKSASQSDGDGREQLAIILGHSVTATASAYGRAAGGRVGIRSIEAIGTRAVKVNHLHGLGGLGGAKATPPETPVTSEQPAASLVLPSPS